VVDPAPLSLLLLALLPLLPLPASPPRAGTTGDDLPWDELRAYAAAGGAVAVSANFSAGVPLLLAMLGACEGRLPQVRAGGG